MFDCTGKIAVVTGSTSGIGLGCATALARAGATVVINDHLGADASGGVALRLAEETGAEIRYVGADMSNAADCAALIAAAQADFGRIDILVNNAGVQHVARIEEFEAAKWDLILAINLTSSFHTIRAAMPGMRARRFGRIINIASVHGLTASPFKCAYVAAKHGLLGLTKTVALEGADDAVTCNAICPGYVLTPLVEGQIEDQMKAHNMNREQVVREVMLQRQGMKEFATTDQIGAACVYLASAEAATVTGASLTVDGGWTAL